MGHFTSNAVQIANRAFLLSLGVFLLQLQLQIYRVDGQPIAGPALAFLTEESSFCPSLEGTVESCQGMRHGRTYLFPFSSWPIVNS